MTAPLQKFLRRHTVPPGNEYFWVHLPTKTEFADPYRDGLFQKIRTFMAREGIEIPDDLEAQVEDFMCKRLPPGFCTKDPDQAKRDPNQCLISWKMVWEGTLVYLRAWAAGKKAWTAMKEAERRARICADCPMNQIAIACLTCYGIVDLMAKHMPHRPPTQQEKRLHVCTACCCLIKVKVAMSENILKTTADHPYHEKCWMHGVKHEEAQPLE